MKYGKKKIISKLLGVHYLLYDLEYQDLVDKYTWYVCRNSRNKNQYYIGTNKKSKGRWKTQHFHTFLFSIKKDSNQQIDHINGDGRDNRRQNLRLADRQENSRNRSKQKNNTSGYKGVYFLRTNKKYAAKIQFNSGNEEFLGSFLDVKEAARAYDKAAIKYFKDFAYTNFPREDYSNE